MARRAGRAERLSQAERSMTSCSERFGASQ